MAHFGLVCAGAVLGAVHLVERRGHGRRLDSKRQIELAYLVEQLPDPVFLFDNQAAVQDCNRLAAELCGRTREQLLGISISDLNALMSARDEHGRPVETFSMGVNRALRDEVVRNVRRVFRNPNDGREIETMTSASPLREESGEISGALLVVRDVTEVTQLQRRLTDTQRHKEIGQMAAGLAHDFNNVLDTIGQVAMLLEMTPGDKSGETKTYTQMIRKAVDRGAEIISRVRDYLRSGTGKPTEVDLRGVLQDVLDLTRPLWQSTTNVKVRTDLHGVPPIRANAADLRRVFTNLVINALEAMPNGGDLSVSCEATGSRVWATVSDTGQGIPPAQQGQIFVPYFTTKPQGTGLGLSGAQRIIGALHGRIHYRSEVGKGTSFVVEFPSAASMPMHEESDDRAA